MCNQDVLDAVDGCFDVVIANINRNILLADMPQFKKMMSPNGTLILSGFYVDDINILKDKAATMGLSLDMTKEKNNWAMAVFSLSGD